MGEHLPNLEPTYIRNSRWRLLTYAIGSTGFFLTISYDVLFNKQKLTGEGTWILWIVLPILLVLSLFFISQYRKHPIEIELSMDYILLTEDGYYNWQDIKHIGTKCLDEGGEDLVLTLNNGKKIKKDVSNLEIDSKELLELINKYVEAR